VEKLDRMERVESRRSQPGSSALAAEPPIKRGYAHDGHKTEAVSSLRHRQRGRSPPRCEAASRGNGHIFRAQSLRFSGPRLSLIAVNSWNLITREWRNWQTRWT
jgi:hypothetical protein